MRIISYPSSHFEKLSKSTQDVPSVIRQAVTDILSQVKKNGDQALIKLTRRFDRVQLKTSQLRIPLTQIMKARVSKDLEKAARTTFQNVEEFCRSSFPKNWSRINRHGAKVGEKFDPLERVGIYVPGGSVPLVSTIFMTAAIARVAGVKQIAVCTPPPVSEALLWALRFCGVEEVYSLGGAQAIAALAYGTRTIPRVDKIFGPGNAYVTEAKRQVFGIVGIDLLAGPSELMILADGSTCVEWAALDLLAQAEHGTGRERIFCVSSSQKVLASIYEKLIKFRSSQPNNFGLKKVLQNGAYFILTKSRLVMAEVANRLAPEHLQIMTSSPQELANRIHTAGGIFLGNYTPTVLGDFVAGPSHTLPTAGAGRSFSGLRVNDFMRRTSMVEYSSKTLKRAASGVNAFASAESLPLHGSSLSTRLTRGFSK
jgi:histidinol dehydrogenase